MNHSRGKVRARFAPSPTGFLHIGSARTALFSWLFARTTHGEFFLRIEDTDKKRSKQKYLNEILESLKWLGLDWDGKPTFQSKRGKAYETYAKKLLDSGLAYPVKGGAVTFRMPKERIVLEDLVHGPIEFDNTLIDDLVIMKSDGYPTYNFACVIDDMDMGITHVIRGDDHISNTPRQLALYRALGAIPPIFAHIPLILGDNKAPLSKRHGATSIEEYKEMGYLPDAMVNFLSLLGWSPGDNREIFKRQDLINTFSLNRVVRTSAVFNQDKLTWLNGQHIKMTDAATMLNLVKPDLKKRRLLKKGFTGDKLKSIVRLYQPRIKKINEFCDQSEYIFQSTIKYDKEAVKKFLKRKELKYLFGLLLDDLKHVTPYDPEQIEKCCRDIIARLGIGGGDLIHPIRTAITGRSQSPGLFDVMAILGQETTVKRIKFALKKYVK